MDKFPSFKDSLSEDDLNAAIRICGIMEGRELYYINNGEYPKGIPLSQQGYHQAVDFLNFIRRNKKELIGLVQDLSKSKKEK